MTQMTMNTIESQVADGVLQTVAQGGGFLRSAADSFQPHARDPWVPLEIIHENALVDGAEVKGLARQGKKRLELVSVDSVCALTPQQFRNRVPFDRLQAVNPTERIRLGDSGNPSMRMIDLIAPIGKGTRGLIVASPKTGKTRLLEELSAAIRATEPETRIVVLLIDERPEEVTHFRRSVDAEVLASSSDQSIEAHIQLAELSMAHIRCELECGRNIVVLVDSITRMARAFNHRKSAGHTMSGGLDSKAMEIPRRFFGLARNIEHGGSVTIIATAMIQTGSRMDDFIFEEFKSTGNSEIVLDRTLAEARIFPAINLLSSGTRKDELLYSDREIQWLAQLRRYLTDVEPKTAMKLMLRLLNTVPTNEQLFQRQIKRGRSN